MTSNQQFDISDPPQDVISALKFSPYSSKLLVSSWDCNLYLYDVPSFSQSRLLETYEHRAPILDVCFGRNDKEAFAAGLDWDVTKIDLETKTTKVLSSHKLGVKSVVYSPSKNLLFSASWDRTLHVHALSNPAYPFVIVSLPHKPFAMSISKDKLVIAMAHRHIFVYELDKLEKLATQSHSTHAVQIEPWQQRESAMKFMTRALVCMPSGLGYAASSIEGRASIEWFDPSPETQKNKYAFKCHRETIDKIDVVYPVNAIAYNPVHTTSFVTGGGDGLVALWDGASKRRIRQYQKFPSSVASMDFSADGKYLAIAYSPGYEDGKEVPNGPIGITIRELEENEAKSKLSK